VAVETAIVMPMFVFLFLGMLQLGLAHQARLMARYAAFKAVRAGALQRAKKDVMENAALAAWLPMVSRLGSPSFFRVGNETDYATSWQLARINQVGPGVKAVEVTICNPLSNRLNPNQDFDDPRVASGDENVWEGFTRTRLHAQVQFNYRLVIPFANGVIWYAALGTNIQNKQELYHVLRLRAKNSDESNGSGGQAIHALTGQAMMGNYYLPIRANYAMRLQSNVAPGALPGQNRCKVNFPKKDNDDHTERYLNTRKLNE
jgi:hypothetical protein